MRMMLILLGSAAFVYYVTGLTGRFTRRKRIYFAMGTYIVVYLITMTLVFLRGNL
jgi:hypothetical protein